MHTLESVVLSSLDFNVIQILLINRRAPATLRNLKWQVPVSWRRSMHQSPWETCRMLLDVVENTCFGLESLDISVVQVSKIEIQPTPTVTPLERVDQYLQANTSASTNLTRLQHFSFKYNYSLKHSSDVEVASSTSSGRTSSH